MTSAPSRVTARSAYRLTASTIAFLGQPRAKQSVRIVTRESSYGVMWFLVAVNETPERYRVTQRMLDRLIAGQTPAQLELEDEPITDEPRPEYADEDRACSRADFTIRSRKEL